ncbi:MAG: hypothetical protein JL50_05040 [Peptococcaceae bacterium BICA1-7]|nr:MAG: hypothetical protein JL50_05040 [Peptococcaceae bacterium BICA1-7]HBV95983.1 hypothetical protein [Desulfotomaculum sp.]
MENLVWAIGLWALVFILIPVERIKQLWPVGVLSFFWMFFLNYAFIKLGYYTYASYLFVVAGVPPLALMGGAAGGILMMNWMQRNPLHKILIVLLFSGFLSVTSELFMRLGAFAMLNGFDHILHFAVNISGVAILVWLSFALVGEERIYEGRRTNFVNRAWFKRIS